MESMATDAAMGTGGRRGSNYHTRKAVWAFIFAVCAAAFQETNAQSYRSILEFHKKLVY
jgi:hypothetical protein